MEIMVQNKEQAAEYVKELMAEMEKEVKEFPEQYHLNKMIFEYKDNYFKAKAEKSSADEFVQLFYPFDWEVAEYDIRNLASMDFA